MATMSGSSWATMEFEFVENGVSRTAVIHLTARGTGDSFEDFTFPVGQILAQAIIAQTNYELVSADLITETATRVYPPA